MVVPAPTMQALRPAPGGLAPRCEGLRLRCTPLHSPLSGRSAPRPGLLSYEKKVGKDSPGTSWVLDLRHQGEDPLGFPRGLSTRI